MNDLKDDVVFSNKDVLKKSSGHNNNFKKSKLQKISIPTMKISLGFK